MSGHERTRDIKDGVRWERSTVVKERYCPNHIEEEMFRLIPLGNGQWCTPNSEICSHLQLTTGWCQGHVHGRTCKKGGRRGDDCDCRMGMPRCIVRNTCHIADGTIAVRQSQSMLVPFVPAMQLACPGNHLMSPSVDAARYLRSLLLHKEESALTPDDKKVRGIIVQTLVIS